MLLGGSIDFDTAYHSKLQEVDDMFDKAKCECVMSKISTIAEASRVCVTLHSSVSSLFNR